MKKLFKLHVLALLTMLFCGITDITAMGIYKNVALKFNTESNKVTYQNNRLTWSSGTNNTAYLSDWYNSDLSQFDIMTVNVSSGSYNVKYRIIITIDDIDYTYYTSGTGTKTINIKTDFKDSNGNTPEINKQHNTFRNIQSIRIGGNSSSGNITIGSVTFHKPVVWSYDRITFHASDFNTDANVTVNDKNFTFPRKSNYISIDFDTEGMTMSDIESIEQSISTLSGSTYQRFKSGSTTVSTLRDAQNRNMNMKTFLIYSNSANTSITMNSITFVKKKYIYNVSQDRIFFEDFEDLSDASFIDGATAPVIAPTASEQGKYYMYGGRGKILKDPTFSNYYQNLADADEYTKSIAENFLRYTFTDAQRTTIHNAIKATGAATVGFWVNGQVAVDYELPLERGSMFCIFSNDRFRKADNYEERPRFMFDLACNGWTYSYMPNTDADGVDIGMNKFFYEEKNKNSGESNPLVSLFGKDNYENTLDQSKYKFYNDRKWHYIAYVMDNNLMRVTVYVDGKKTGEIPNIADKEHNPGLSEAEFNGNNDYVGRTYYLRNIILGGFTPHGLFYDKQYYSDAALAYDDIAIYGKALTQQQIQSIIEQKQYTPSEWHYGDSFTEYNENKGGHEIPENISGLNVESATFDNETGYLILNSGTMLTIPSVPKNYYVRIEYAYASDTKVSPTSASANLAYIGIRNSEQKTGYYVKTYKANEAGTFHINIKSDLHIRSIVITPYQYAKLKYGKWNQETGAFTALSVSKKYVKYDVKRINGHNFYKDENGDDVGENPFLPELSLRIDGKNNSKDGKAIYEDISDYTEGVNYPYIKYTSTAPHIAYITKNGNITMTGIAGNTTIIAEIISDNLFIGSEVVDSFEIRIRKEENTLRLSGNESVKINQKFPDENSDKDLKNITLTIGGWDYNETYEMPGVGPIKDSWTNTKTFYGPTTLPKKKNDEILDDFNKYSTGKYSAKSESYGRDNGDFDAHSIYKDNITIWTLPCRGAYVKFEPLKPGIVTMYLLQNGNLDKTSASDTESAHLSWKPVYITDETGKIVDFVQTATNGRITFNDNFFISDKRRAQFIESIENTYNSNETLRQDLLALRDSDNIKFHTLIDNWCNAGWRQRVIPTGDGGYMVMSKAIVRYTFNVYPGKTYYLFSNDTQISISGFNFEEGRLLNIHNNYDTAPVRDATEGNIIRFTDSADESQPAIPTDNKDLTTVEYVRNFTQNKWSSICLPFSMNNRQMREQFGEETAVIILKNIHDDGKVELIWHVNQDIVAGYPYFILPSGAVKHNNIANSVITKITVNAFFNDGNQKENPLFSVGSNGKTFNWQGVYNGDCYKADFPYVFEGNYRNEEIPAGSYVMSTNGVLSKLKKNAVAKPFRAYLKYQGSNANNTKPLYTSISNSETTSINDIFQQNSILTDNCDVYSISGTKLSNSIKNLMNLPKGVYIMNGKKYIVK